MARASFRRVLLGSGTGLLVLAAAVTGSYLSAQPRSKHLAIGASNNLVSTKEQDKVNAALGTLQSFIKSETGFNNDILHQKNWQELADKLASGQLQLGVLHGYEFAWAQARYPRLKALALAVNVYRYPTVYVVIRNDDATTDFAGLRGRSVAVAGGGVGCVQLFVDRQCRIQGTEPKQFFARVDYPESLEDALDDIVDRKVQVVVVERAGLESYKRRKPGRFKQLKQVLHSEPFPPPLIAYYDKGLSAKTLQRFRAGLLKANQKEKGQTLLTLFKLNKFEKVPRDFNQMLEQTRTAFPPPAPSQQ